MAFQHFKLLRERFQHPFEMLAALHERLVPWASSYCTFTYAWVYLHVTMLSSWQTDWKFCPVTEWTKIFPLYFLVCTKLELVLSLLTSVRRVQKGSLLKTELGALVNALIGIQAHGQNNYLASCFCCCGCNVVKSGVLSGGALSSLQQCLCEYADETMQLYHQTFSN